MVFGGQHLVQSCKVASPALSLFRSILHNYSKDGFLRKHRRNTIEMLRRFYRRRSKVPMT